MLMQTPHGRTNRDDISVEERCLMIYKNPVRTSQETPYVSTIEPHRLMLCKI
jgi:hypothetical protein